MNKYFMAIDILTGLHIRPFITEAYSEREYKCLDEKCNGKVIFCAEKSEKVRPYFRHVKSEFNCNRYNESKCNEQTIHNEAILVLKNIISTKSSSLIIKQKCKLYGNRCGFETEYEFDEFDIINDQLIIESKYENSRHRADLVWFNNKKPYIIFEIKYTHDTKEKDRKEIIWYELEAEDILKSEKNENNQYVLNCLRNTGLTGACEKCLIKHKKQCLEAIRLEQERLDQERLDRERLDQERLKQECFKKIRLEQERLQQEQLEQERLQKQKEFFKNAVSFFKKQEVEEQIIPKVVEEYIIPKVVEEYIREKKNKIIEEDKKLFNYRGGYYCKPPIYHIFR